MVRVRKRSDVNAADLSAAVAHELSNIGVPLLGFLDLAAENAPQGELMGPYLDELRIGVARIAALASDLETLAQCSSHPRRCAIGECVPDAQQGIHTWKMNWQCSASTMVKVDPFHVRHAIDTLARAALTAATQDSPAMLTVTKETLPSASCAACGAAISPRSKHVLVRAHGARLATAGALRNPLGPQSAGRAMRKLGLAILVHSAHRGGGHILFSESAASLSVALSAA